eukprot:198611-Rhodomonas_salina.1
MLHMKEAHARAHACTHEAARLCQVSRYTHARTLTKRHTDTRVCAQNGGGRSAVDIMAVLGAKMAAGGAEPVTLSARAALRIMAGSAERDAEHECQ